MKLLLKLIRLRNSKELLKTQGELEDKPQLLRYIWDVLYIVVAEPQTLVILGEISELWVIY